MCARVRDNAMGLLAALAAVVASPAAAVYKGGHVAEGTHVNDVLPPIASTTDMYERFPAASVWPFLAFLNASDDASWPWLDGPNGSLFANGSQGLDANSTTVASGGQALYDLILLGVTSIVLGLMILITVIGNVFVIAAILLERNLQNVANYLIVSLAVADLMVACLVMPLGAVYEISRGWILGPELCDMWTSSDVLCCTASILHLVAIAVDRYWAVTNVDYIHTRNGRRIGVMILVVWCVAVIVSLAPQFGWKDPDYLDRINVQQKCLVSQDLAYQVFATCSTFYVPLLVILVLYWRIFQTARTRIRRRRDQRSATVLKTKTPTASMQKCSLSASSGVDLGTVNAPAVVSMPTRFKRRLLRSRLRYQSNRKQRTNATAEALVASLMAGEGQSTATASTTVEQTDDGSGSAAGDEEATTAFTITRAVAAAATATNITAPAVSNNVSPEKSSTTNNGSASHQSHISDISRVEILGKESEPSITAECPAALIVHQKQLTQQQPSRPPSRRETRETLEAKRERKAAKTLAIITGAFVVCWLPFFIWALLMPLCSSCAMNDHVASLFLWLGYFNSTLNPVIYTIFSPEFRQAFKRILCGAHSRRRRRPAPHSTYLRTITKFNR